MFKNPFIFDLAKNLTHKQAEAIQRPEASYRRMLVSQPPVPQRHYDLAHGQAARSGFLTTASVKQD